MPETGFITAKIMSGVGGLLGGMTLMAFMKPQSILDATLRGGIDRKSTRLNSSHT